MHTINGHLKKACLLQEDVRDVQREVEILNLVSDHPNVAELVNTFEDTHYVHLVRITLLLCTCGIAVLAASCSRTVQDVSLAASRGETSRSVSVQILELCHGGELFDRIVEQGTFTERAAAGDSCCSVWSNPHVMLKLHSRCRVWLEKFRHADYFRTMVLVIDHMHQLGVMHR